MGLTHVVKNTVRAVSFVNCFQLCRDVKLMFILISKSIKTKTVFGKKSEKYVKIRFMTHPLITCTESHELVY